ncbi:Pycsar system effector family protein [Nibrella saemangeumensis]
MEDGEVKKKKKKKENRGVETMFRTTMASHLKLSEMADSKANIMISINTIIVSILISVYAKDFDNAGTLLIPTGILTTVCLLTITISVLSTRPRIKSDQPANAPETPAKADLLFFGDYIKLSREEYRTSLFAVLDDNDAVHAMMVDNLYAQGLVLTRKYRLLTYAYTIFMIGFPLAVLAYAIALLIGR